MTSKARPNPPRANAPIIIGREAPRMASKLATNVNNCPRNTPNAVINCGTSGGARGGLGWAQPTRKEVEPTLKIF